MIDGIIFGTYSGDKTLKTQTTKESKRNTGTWELAQQSFTIYAE